MGRPYRGFVSGALLPCERRGMLRGEPFWGFSAGGGAGGEGGEFRVRGTFGRAGGGGCCVGAARGCRGEGGWGGVGGVWVGAPQILGRSLAASIRSAGFSAGLFIIRQIV